MARPGIVLRLAVVAGILGSARGALAWEVGVAPATTKVLPATPTPALGAASLEAARGEWEAFQIVVRDSAGAERVDVALSNLCAPGGACIPATAARLYREYFVHVVSPSPGSIVGHARAAGDYPDPLIPFQDPYASSPVPVGAPFDLAPTGTGVVFVDVLVPPGTPAGAYTGTATVSATGRPSKSIPVTLTVWDFDMPRQRSVATAYGYSANAAWAFHGGPKDGDTPERDRIADRYALALHEHRIDPESIDGPLQFTFDASGQLEPVDFSAYDQAVGPWLDGTKFGDGIGVARFDINHFSPGGGTGSMTDAQYAQAGKAFAEHLQVKGWWKKAYAYASDEPWLNGPPKSYLDIDHDADLLIGASGLWNGHILVTSPFQPLMAGRIGIWCPNTAMYEDWNSLWGPLPGRDTYAQRRALGEELWFYVSNAEVPPYAGYDIDTAIGYEPRIVKWGAFYEHATGFLYWETQYWVNDDPWNVLLNIPGFTTIFARNGDGFIFYPGNHDGTAMGKGSPSWLAIDGPIVSYRMKQIRDGLEDWELFRMASELGAEAYVRQQVGRAYTRFGAFFTVNCNDVGDYCPQQQPWTLDESLLAQVRHDVASKVLFLLHPDRYPDPEASAAPARVSAGGCGCRLGETEGSGIETAAAFALLAAAGALLRRRHCRHCSDQLGARPPGPATLSE